MKSDIEKVKDIKCPECGEKMILQSNAITSNTNNSNEQYHKAVYWCEKDDVWISREIPHKVQKQITVFSGVLIKDDKVLMILRNEPELPEAHLKWEFPGGKCDFGETPPESLAREFFEETGIKVTVSDMLPYVQTNYWRYPWGIQQTFCFIFICTLDNEGIRKEDHHVKEIEWIPIKEAYSLPSLPGTAAILTLAKDTIK